MALGIGIFTTLAGLLWMGFAMSIGAPGFFPLFGLLFVGVGIFNAMRMSAKADDFHRSHRAYLSKRHDLLSYPVHCRHPRGMPKKACDTTSW